MALERSRGGVVVGEIDQNCDHKLWQLIVIASCSRVEIVIDGARHKLAAREVGRCLASWPFRS